MSISKRFLTFVFAAIIACSCFAVGELAAQQKYRGMPIKPGYAVGPELTPKASKDDRAAWKKKYGPAKKRISAGNNNVKAVLAAGGDVKADPEARKYLETVVFPAMTQTGPNDLASLGIKRQDFLKNFLNKGVTGVARARMIDFTIQTLQGYCANTNLHPSARLNAVVLMSQLTDRPLVKSAQAPAASGKAFVVLQKIFSSQNEKQFPEYLKIAAFTGMKNQLEMNSKSGQSVNSTVRSELAEAVLKMLAAEVDSTKDAAGYWKKRQAVQMAGVLRDAKTLPPLLAILNDDVSNFELKLDVVKTIIQAGSMGADSRTNGTVVASVSKFAGIAVASEATNIIAAREKMIRNGILFGDVDLMQSKDSIDFQPQGGDGSGGRDFGSDTRATRKTPLVELPNYQLNFSRNRIRAISIFCKQAIGVDQQGGLRRGLAPKADTLASGTIRELDRLLEKSNVGLVDVDVRIRDGDPTPQELDLGRETSYVDQMVKVCESSAETLKGLLETYAAE